ncbi:MAG: hypothetical protein ACKOWF_15085 [Chloroflexota bacterium]
MSRRAGAAAAASAVLAAGAGVGASAGAKRGAATAAAPAPGAWVGDEKRPCGPTAKDNRCLKDKDCCTNKCQKPGPGEKYGRCRCIKPGKKCTPKQICCGGATCTGSVCTPPAPVCLPTVSASGTAVANGVGLTAALAAAPAGATLILAPGQYAGDFSIQKDVTLTSCPGAGEVVVMNIATYVDSTPVNQGRTFFVGVPPASSSERQGRLVGPSLTLTGITVTRNVASGLGGGIFVGEGASLFLLGSTVIRGAQNKADGAGIEVISGNVYVGCDRVADPACTDSVLIGDPDPGRTNRAISSDAAAIQVSSASKVVIRGNARLEGNIADGSGGAIYMTGTSTVLVTDDAQIVNNAAGPADSRRGGAVRISGTSVLTLAGNARISGNSAYNGGAIYLTEADRLFITGGAVVSGNIALGTGGGIYMDPGTATPSGVSLATVFGNINGTCANFYTVSNTTCVTLT